MTDHALRHGDLVEVKPAAEILATLDDRGSLEGLPFMAEMVALCGRRFTVDKRAEKICDTINWSGSRRLPNTVMLEDLRCDGSGHEGCQAECRLFWKEAWLRRVRADEPASRTDSEALARLLDVVNRNSRYTEHVNGQPRVKFRCQATELYNATHGVSTWDPRSYTREYATGNVGLGTFVKVLGRALVRQPMRKLGLAPYITLAGKGIPPKTAPGESMQPGDLVMVRSREEIGKTLTPEGRNRGLWFDGDEMLPFCGQTFRVRRRISHFIDDRNGDMLRMKSDCLTLEGVVCSGERSLSRWFCPRQIYPYWREAWLKKVQAGPAAGGESAHEPPVEAPLPVAVESSSVTVETRPTGSVDTAKKQDHHPGTGQIRNLASPGSDASE